MSYDIVLRTDLDSETLDMIVERVRGKVRRKATIFLFPYSKVSPRALAIDTEPNVNWSADIMAGRQIIGVFTPKQFDEIIRTYAPFL